MKQYSNNIVIFLISLWFSQQLIKWRTSSSAENHSVEQRRNCLGHNLHRGLFFVKYVNLLNARQNIFAGKQNFPEHDIDYSKESKMYFYIVFLFQNTESFERPNLISKSCYQKCRIFRDPSNFRALFSRYELGELSSLSLRTFSRHISSP